jgi:hypothetical protein
MKLKFLRTLVLALAAFVAVSVFATTDDFKELEAGYIQGEMLKASAEGLTPSFVRELVRLAPLASSGRRKYPHTTLVATKSPALICLSTCVLLC